MCSVSCGTVAFGLQIEFPCSRVEAGYKKCRLHSLILHLGAPEGYLKSTHLPAQKAAPTLIGHYAIVVAFPL